MSGTGFLGLPTDISRYNFQEILFTFSNSRLDELTSHIRQFMETDHRAIKLKGRMLSNGRSGKQFQINDFCAWWAWRANSVGKTQAALELELYLDCDRIDTLQAIWLYGPTVRSITKLAGSISLIPRNKMPTSIITQWISSQLHNFIPFKPNVPSAAIVNCININKYSDDLNDIQKNEYELKMKNLRSAALLLNAMPGLSCVPAIESSHLPDSIPPALFSNFGGGSQPHDVVPNSEVEFHQPSEIGFESLFKSFLELGEDKKLIFERALYRIGQSKARTNLNDRALDLGIAIEMLLLNNTKSEQLSLTFRTRGAWFMGESPDDRKIIHNDLKEIYDLRSHVAHNGYSKLLDLTRHKRSEIQEKLNRHMNLGERIIRKSIVNPNVDWENLVLGV